MTYILPDASMAGALAAVDMEDFARHEVRRFEVEDRLDDVGGLAHAPYRFKRRESVLALDRVHRRLDIARRDRVHAYAAFCIFDGKRFGCSGETALRQRSEHGGDGRP